MVTRILQGLLKALIIACLLVIVVSIGIGVVFRYFLDTPLSWTDEVSRFAMVWMTFLGAALLTSYRDGHVNVDFFVNLMGSGSQRLAVLFATLLELGIVVLLMIGGILLMRASQRMTSPALFIPMMYVYAVIPAYGVMSVWFIGARLFGRQRAGQEVS